MPHKLRLLATLIFALAPLSLVAAEARAETYLGAIGGGGGSQFTHPCANGQNLAGFELRVGDWVDAMRPVCVISHGPAQTDPPPIFSGVGVALAEWHGGPGGGPSQLLCPPSTPIVLGIRIWAEGKDTVSVHGIHLYCGLASTVQSLPSEPSAIFEGQPVPADGTFLGLSGPGGKFGENFWGRQNCPAGQVAVGVQGRSGIWLDAIGLICDAPRLDSVLLPPLVVATPEKPTIKAQGRVRLDGGAATGQTRSICDLARQARARNSPAAPGLEAKCKEVGEGAQPARTAKVILGVDVFDAPGGAGNRIGALNTDTIVGLVACQPDNWCHVNGNNVPGGDGWVYSGPDYRSLQV